jgi:hypothetical protein
MFKRETIPYIVGALGVVILSITIALSFFYDDISFSIAKLRSNVVHVHADFAFYVLGTNVDLTDAKYQSSKESIKHPSIHLHDGFDNVIHRHTKDVTFTDFLSSIGFTLTDSCVTMGTGTQYCTDQTNTLKLYVNGRPKTDVATYIIKEEDQILLYYGDPQSDNIIKYQEEITEDSCLYSGNCPERGDPPAESCGLTCEI